MSDWEGAALTDGIIDLFWSQGTLDSSVSKRRCGITSRWSGKPYQSNA